MQISSKLNDLRNKHGLTYQQLADASGVPIGTLKSILSGTTASPAFETVCAILRAMGESVDEFCGYTAPAQIAEEVPAAAPVIAEHRHYFTVTPLHGDMMNITRDAIADVYSGEAYRIVHSNLKWWRAIAITLIALVIGWFTWDITHPKVGLIQYSTQVPEQAGNTLGAIVTEDWIV